MPTIEALQHCCEEVCTIECTNTGCTLHPFNNEPSSKDGAKHDDWKPDLSLIPMSIIVKEMTRGSRTLQTYDYVPEVMQICHDLINGIAVVDVVFDISNAFDLVISSDGLYPLAEALGYGCVKYGRNNWKKGFHGNFKRLLKATMRHCLQISLGAEYDGEAKEGHPQGNNHRGAIAFSLMVALNEAEFSINGARRW